MFLAPSVQSFLQSLHPVQDQVSLGEMQPSLSGLDVALLAAMIYQLIKLRGYMYFFLNTHRDTHTEKGGQDNCNKNSKSEIERHMIGIRPWLCENHIRKEEKCFPISPFVKGEYFS